jgi:hypothetical protein
LQNLAASFGAKAGIDVYADPPVVALLGDVRGRLLKYATEAWIEHSPRVVAGMEEGLRQIESTAARTLSTTETDPTAISSLLGEYLRRVKEGSRTQAEFDKFSDILHSALQDPHVHSQSVKVSPPVPINSGRSVPSSSSTRCTTPPAVAKSLEVTVRPAPNPDRQAAVAAATGFVVCIVLLTSAPLTRQYPSRNLPPCVAPVSSARGLPI